MKKIVAFLLVLSTFFLCGCSSDKGLFEYLNEKDAEEMRVFPHVDTGIEAELLGSVEQQETAFLLDGEKYVSVADYKVSKNAKRIKAVANYQYHTFYEFETDCGVRVLADNIYLQIFVKQSDRLEFISYYEDLNNYNRFCYDSKNNMVDYAMDSSFVQKMFSSQVWVNEGECYDVSLYRKSGINENFTIDGYDEIYFIKTVSTDWLLEYYEGMVICRKDEDFYITLRYKENYEPLKLSDEYQQYFKKAFAEK